MVHEQLYAGVLVAFAAVLMLLQQFRRKSSLKKLPPGPLNLPVVGSSYIVGRYPNAWDAFSDLRRRYGDVYSINLGSRRCLVVSSIDALREVLVTKASDFADRPDSLRYHAIFKDNRNLSIALCDWSSKQRTRRELCYPVMHPKQASAEQSRLSNCIETELGHLTAELSRTTGTPIKPRQALLVTTANIFYTFFCSERFTPDDPKFLRIVDLYNEVFHQLFQGFAIDFMPWLKVLQGKQLCLLKEKSMEIYRFTLAIMDRREKVIASGIGAELDQARDLMDVLLLSLKGPSAEGQLDKIDVAVVIEDLIGGHSVIANLWVWCLYILSDYPDVQSRIREETRAIASSESGLPSLLDRSRMCYTEATLYEVMRVVNSPIIPHVCSSDTTVQGFHVNRGTVVMFNTNDMNYSSDLWEKPWVFNPERFLSDDGHYVLKPGHFFPFGTGKRSCMGDGLVRATLILGMATLLGHFELSLAPGQEPARFADFRSKVIFDRDPEIVFTEVAARTQFP
ncbi:LOW QUALITY PROTEIN: cytochrome P450 307a1-like [Rhipicephalus sanguineus]|nr:LOW QUALITY PROTEIN: cytochrome P450 307a1-like [Rhipicephalus sanguineus]